MFGEKSLEEIYEMCKDAQKESIGKNKVGVVCAGIKFEENKKIKRYWSGANISISDTSNDFYPDSHGEEIAVYLALLERYYPTEIYFVSENDSYILKFFSILTTKLVQINKDMKVIFLNSECSVKSKKNIQKIYEFKIGNKITENNKRIKELCGIKKEIDI